MKIVHTTSYLDGGTIVLLTDTKKRYYIDNRLGSRTVGEVFDSYPSGGNIVPQEEVWDLIKAIKEYDDVEYKKYNLDFRKHALALLGTA